MDTNAYLDRIAYRGSLAPRAETLRQLHLAHLRTVPFENLSIHWGEPIVLDDEALFDKIVRRRRGGFCYELNGLFAALLRALGFEVEMLAAAVMGAQGQYGRDFAHMALRVQLGRPWLADVGFGDSFLEPLRLDERLAQPEGDRAYRIAEGGGERRVLQRREGEGEWSAQYRFRLQPFAYGDFAEMCHHQQTSPESHFTQRRVCSRATPRGRISLSERRLITTEDGQRQERELAQEAEVVGVLRGTFGIEVSA